MDPPQSGTVPETAPDGRRLTPPLYVVVLLAVVLLINYVDRGALGTAGPLILRDLHLTNGQYGMLSSAFFWMYALIQIPVGAIAERFGAHRVLTAGLVIWATATALTGITSGFSMLIALRMMLGLGESVGFPTVSKLLAAVVPVKGLGMANGIVAFGYLIGPGVGVVLAGILIDYVGWRGMFLVFGVCSLLWLIPWLVVRLPRIATQRSDPSAPTLGMVLSQRGLWGTSLGLFSSNYMWYFILFWLPGYLVKERGFSMHAMEHVATAGYLVNGLSAFIVGWAIDRYILRGGSANFAYKLIMFIAHVALRAQHARHGTGHGIHGHRRHVRLPDHDGGFLARHVRHVANSRGTQGLGPLGRHPKLPRKSTGGDLSLGHRHHRRPHRTLRARLRRRRPRERARHRRLDRHRSEGRADQMGNAARRRAARGRGRADLRPVFLEALRP